MPKKQGTIRTAVQPHGSENRDQTASHDSLLPFESEPLKKQKQKQKQKNEKQKRTQKNKL